MQAVQAITECPCIVVERKWTTYQPAITAAGQTIKKLSWCWQPARCV